MSEGFGVLMQALDRMAAFRPTFNILLAINVTLCIIQINNYLDVKDVAGSNSRLNAALAGASSSPVGGCCTLFEYLDIVVSQIFQTTQGC